MFCTATETVSELENQALCTHAPAWPHKSGDRETAVFGAADPTLDNTLAPFYLDPLLLYTNAKLLECVDVFIDEFLGLNQGPTHRRHHVRRTLFHALDRFFGPLDNLDPTQRKEFISLKNLHASD